MHRPRKRRGSCDGKIRHQSEEGARDAAITVGAKARVTMDYYECPVCGPRIWHIGHPTRRKKRLRRERRNSYNNS